MALPSPKAASRTPKVVGSTKPRLSPPQPARADLSGFRAEADGLGIKLMPWQEVAARYLVAKGQGDRHLYSEVCIVVARQQGKTTLMKPLIVQRLRAGRHILHIAQNRNLPRTMFATIADALSAEPELFPKRRGRTQWPRFGAGQEEIVLTNGGSYRIAAANRGGARGQTIDDLLIDELREMESNEVIGDAGATTGFSTDPQTIYLSNAGTTQSVVLNDVRARKDGDRSLAYLEWSASPERKPDDRAGWLEANPAIGHYEQVMRNLEATYQRHLLAGTMPIFETENLCRWVTSTAAPLVIEGTWAGLQTDDALGLLPLRPMMAVSMDPSGTRASAVVAWRGSEDDIRVRVVGDVTGDPIPLDVFGPQLRDLARQLGVKQVGFAPWTDADLARWFPNAKPLDGRTWAVASEAFARMVEGGKVHWDGTNEIGDDLAWTVRKPHEGGAWHAVKARDDRPITAALAAVRAVWLASDPKRPGSLRVQ